MYFEKGTRIEKNPVFMKFYTLHKSMMHRCYLETCHNYSRYGGAGVTVKEEWKNLDYFFKTIEEVDGYDFDRIMSGELALDKDIKYIGNKVYSKENCMFVTRSDNSGNRPSVSKFFVAVDPNYNYKTYRNREKFCRENNLDVRHVWKILQNKGLGTHKQWQFFYLKDFSEDLIVKRRKFEAVSPTNKVYTYEKHSVFAKEHNLSAPNIIMVIKGKNKHHKGWKFKEITDTYYIKNKI